MLTPAQKVVLQAARTGRHVLVCGAQAVTDPRLTVSRDCKAERFPPITEGIITTRIVGIRITHIFQAN